MRTDREIPSTGEVVSIYWCDKCGKNSAFSDYRWPGHKHWEEYNYTLCYECLIELNKTQNDREDGC